MNTSDDNDNANDHSPHIVGHRSEEALSHALHLIDVCVLQQKIMMIDDEISDNGVQVITMMISLMMRS